MTQGIMAFFEDFLQNYPARLPRIQPGHPDEVVLLTEPDGVCEFSLPPIHGTTKGHPPGEGAEVANTYLWVILADKIPYILENGAAAARLHRGLVKHTNLTGGGPANCGGEIWFSDDSFFYFSGKSGRYGPETEEKLRDVALSFRECGHSFICLGWDDEYGGPSRVYREGEAWDYRK